MDTYDDGQTVGLEPVTTLYLVVGGRGEGGGVFIRR
jgi:hypothetical protein